MGDEPIEAVLFDYGGVFTVSPFAAVESLAKKLELSPQTLMGLVFGPYDRDTDHPWHRLERGEIALQDAREGILELSRQHGSEVDLFQYFGAIASITSGVVEPMVECARKLKGDGYRTAMLTNNVAEFSEHWRQTLPLDELFDSVIDSSQIGMRKPDPKIFAHALECIGNVEARRAVFLDDYQGNVDAARRLGMHGILVESDPSAALSELEALLVP